MYYVELKSNEGKWITDFESNDFFDAVDWAKTWSVGTQSRILERTSRKSKRVIVGFEDRCVSGIAPDYRQMLTGRGIIFSC